MIVNSVNSHDLLGEMRFDGSFHLSSGMLWQRKIKSHKYDYLQNLSKRIFGAGREKRIYVNKEIGIPLLSNTNMMSIDPFATCKYISRKYGFNPEFLLQKGMILTGRVGAIGHVAYVRDDMVGSIGSDNIIRIVTNKRVLSGYLYAFLSSSVGKALLCQLATGGVQSYIDINDLKNIPIPIPETDVMEVIHSKIEESARLRTKANKQIISTWEKSCFDIYSFYSW